MNARHEEPIYERSEDAVMQCLDSTAYRAVRAVTLPSDEGREPVMSGLLTV